MAVGVRVGKKHAQKLKNYLSEQDLLKGGISVIREGEHIVFPLAGKPSKKQKTEMKKISKKIKFVQRKFPGRDLKPKNLKDALKGKLTKKEMSKLITSFDVLGDIAIMEIPKELRRKEKIIGNSLLQVNKSIKVVCKKVGIHSGKYRLQKVRVIAGEKRKTAHYKESGCRFMVTVDKTFFSVRLGSERKRIAGLIKKGETIGALFAGVGPFPIVFAKTSGMKKAFAVELNPFAYMQMVENIKLNKVQGKVEAIKGNVRRVVPKMLKGKCDRIVMPLPKGGETFLKEAIMCLQEKGGVIHFYQFVPRDSPYREAVEKVKKAAKKMKRKVKILRKAQVRTFSPAVIQVVIDFRVF